MGMAVCEQILQVCSRADKGFDAIENGLRNFIIDGLCGDGCWAEVRKKLGIYTVSGRVKSHARIQQKVLVKAAAEVLTPENFYKRIPDLIGVRVVCLHPDDLPTVAIALKDLVAGQPDRFGPPPSPLVQFRVRRGEFTRVPTEKFESAGFQLDDPHEVGYSSIHFVLSLRENFRHYIDSGHTEAFKDLKKIPITTEEFLVEIQLRTILEEAWAETDHWIRYEDEALSSDNELKNQFHAMAAYIQAGNHHISIIRNIASRKMQESKELHSA